MQNKIYTDTKGLEFINILITGATGFIASHTIVELQQAGHNIIGVDNLSNSSADLVRYAKCR